MKLNLNDPTHLIGLAGLLPSLGLLAHFFFFAKSDGERKHKLYHVSGEWMLRFFYLSLAILPLYDFFPKRFFMLLSTNIFAYLSFYYSLIHVFAYLRYTLNRDGYTFKALLKQINTRDYLIYGILAFLCLVYFVGISHNKYIFILAVVLGCYHVMMRNWDRLGKGKSAVSGAKEAPFIVAALVGYHIVRNFL